jgi:hypothetical protein
MSEDGTRVMPRLNERILSSMNSRSVAAHPWHDLEIGKTTSTPHHPKKKKRRSVCVLKTINGYFKGIARSLLSVSSGKPACDLKMTN